MDEYTTEDCMFLLRVEGDDADAWSFPEPGRTEVVTALGLRRVPNPNDPDE